MNEAFSTASEVIQKMDSLTEVDKKLLIDPIRQCVSAPMLNDSKVWNQATAPFIEHYYLSDYAGKNTDPRFELNHSFPLIISLPAWAQCENGTTECFNTLFHEFGHVLNSCNFEKMSLANTSPFGEVSFGIQQAWLGIRTPDGSSVYSFLTEKSRLLSETLKGSSNCLKDLSAPKEAVLNSCELSYPAPRESRRRCGIGAIPSHPTQWNEAEADFIGATFFSHWLKKRPSLMERHAMTFDAFAAECELDSYNNKVVSEDMSEADRFGLRGVKATPKQGRLIVVEPACQRVVLNGEKAPKPWYDPHQLTAVRINRNYLRNSDLRDALGCPRVTAQIPMSCSPLGKVSTLMPRN